VTATAETTDWTRMEVFELLIRLIAFTLPLMMIVVPLQPKMLTDWLISTLSTVIVSVSWNSISHLLPSNKNLGGFLPARACGFEGLVGFLPIGESEGDLAGTTLLALSAGFLCVISLLSTLRSPLVTSSPRLSCAKTAAAPPAGAAGLAAAGLASGTGGGGGGGGGGEVEEAPVFEALYCSMVTPLGFQTN